MNSSKIKRASVLLVAGAIAFGAAAETADARIPRPWTNCKAVNAKYLHGVGKVGAHDKTSGGPVTNFKRSDKLYRLPMSYNRGLDRDRDGIACEKK